jgi:hypothetical protein
LRAQLGDSRISKFWNFIFVFFLKIMIFQICALILLFLLSLPLFPLDRVLGTLYSTVKIRISEVDNPHVFWFSHCFTPVDFFHSTIAVAKAINATVSTTQTVYILVGGFWKSGRRRRMEAYIRHQVRMMGLHRARFRMIARPHRLKVRLLEKNCHAIVFHPYSHSITFSRDRQKLREEIRIHFRKVWNPHSTLPPKAILQICLLRPLATRKYDKCIPIDHHRWNVPALMWSGPLFAARCLVSPFSISTQRSERHNHDEDPHLLNMLVRSVEAMHDLGLCSK